MHGRSCRHTLCVCQVIKQPRCNGNHKTLCHKTTTGQETRAIANTVPYTPDRQTDMHNAGCEGMGSQIALGGPCVDALCALKNVYVGSP